LKRGRRFSELHEISRFSQAVERWRTMFLEQSRLEAQFIPLLLLGLLQAAGLFHSRHCSAPEFWNWKA
jgi:hypothetical protein